MVRASPIHDHFGRFATGASGGLGSTWAFIWAGLVVVVWAATGPILHFSDHWLMVVSTGRSIATFLIVFLIQNTHNCDVRAINLKLNELIPVMETARNQIIDIESLSNLELDAIQQTYEKIKTGWTNRQSQTPRLSAEE